MIGENIFLRALEPSDLPQLYAWENEPANWLVSNTTAPFSRYILQKFIESPQDLYTQRQLRLMVCEKDTQQVVGAVDIFDFEPSHQRAGIGILIAPEFRQRGYGLESIQLVKKYLFDTMLLHQIYCNIMTDNKHSISIFEKAGFEICGCKRDWVRTSDGFVDEYLLQCMNKKETPSVNKI